jgi:hypothetical protein
MGALALCRFACLLSAALRSEESLALYSRPRCEKLFVLALSPGIVKPGKDAVKVSQANATDGRDGQKRAHAHHGAPRPRLACAGAACVEV